MLKLNSLEMALPQALEERDRPWVVRSDRAWVEDVNGDILSRVQSFREALAVGRFSQKD